jgi:hypothetical protein
MRHRFGLMLVAMTSVAAPVFAQGDKGAAGTWQGTIDRDGAQAPITLRLAQRKGHWKARADVDGASSPASKVEVEGDHVRFSLKGQGSFDGKYSQDSLTGSFSATKKGRPPANVSLTRQVESEDEMNAKIDAVVESEGP